MIKLVMGSLLLISHPVVILYSKDFESERKSNKKQTKTIKKQHKTKTKTNKETCCPLALNINKTGGPKISMN